LILLDVRMPDMDGYEICRRLKEDRRTAHVPVIFVSALQDAEAKDRGFLAGGVDYISKPFEESEVLARVKTHTHLHQLQQNLEQMVSNRTLELETSQAELEEKVEELKKSEERYELAVAGSSAGLWDWNILSDNLFTSDRFKELLGYGPDEIDFQMDEFWNRLQPEDVDFVKHSIDKHLEERIPFIAEYRLRTKSGKYSWFHARGQAIWDERGEAVRMSGSITDISPRKKAEGKILRSEERFRSLLEQSPMPIEILSTSGKIVQFNSSWEKLWGVDEVAAAETMEKYNMRTDPQLKELGVNDLVEKAFSGEHIILPSLVYDANETATDFDIKNLEGFKSPWVQCHLYPLKDKNGTVVNVVNTYIDISDLKNAETEIRNAYGEISELKDQLEAESTYLQEEIKLEHNFENIIGRSESLKYVLNRIEQVAATESPVLIMGETGTGKELIARALHQLSARNKRPLVKVNCAALPSDLIESELFGREKGAFTGATTTQPGRFELAKGSTLFLDEIGELPLELQAKLLRVLDSGEFERLGSSHTIKSNARIIAATNRVLEEEVRNGCFREDLWYRLKVFPITVPPLRERAEDIPLLITWFVDQLSKKMGKKATEIPKSTMKMLQKYPWPGNVRELKNAVEGALIGARGKKLHFELPQVMSKEFSNFQSFEEMERDYIIRVLESCNWKIGGENSAASTLDMHVNTLRGRMKKLGIKKP
jgi:PAS domain S-box-containing protein